MHSSGGSAGRAASCCVASIQLVNGPDVIIIEQQSHWIHKKVFTYQQKQQRRLPVCDGDKHQDSRMFLLSMLRANRNAPDININSGLSSIK